MQACQARPSATVQANQPHLAKLLVQVGLHLGSILLIQLLSRPFTSILFSPDSFSFGSFRICHLRLLGCPSLAGNTIVLMAGALAVPVSMVMLAGLVAILDLLLLLDDEQVLQQVVKPLGMKWLPCPAWLVPGLRLQLECDHSQGLVHACGAMKPERDLQGPDHTRQHLEAARRVMYPQHAASWQDEKVHSKHHTWHPGAHTVHGRSGSLPFLC